MMIRGANVSVSELIQLKSLASGIVPTLRSKVFGQLVGQSSARARGRGLDFQEARHYQPGDELRSIDWRVTARTGQPHTKLFHEEREKPVLLVVDQRDCMKFGSQSCFKSVQAAATASLLGWASLYDQDRVGCLIFNNSAHTEFRPSSSPRAFLHMLDKLVDFATPDIRSKDETSAKDFTLSRATAEIRQLVRPGTSIFIISDFSGYSDDCFAHLSQIGRHCDITAIRIHDAMEASLPQLGKANFSNGTDTYHVNHLKSLNTRFEQNARRHRDELVAELARLKIATIDIATSDNVRAVLETHFLKTTRMSRAGEVLHG